jgi:hypothetical protein
VHYACIREHDWEKGQRMCQNVKGPASKGLNFFLALDLMFALIMTVNKDPYENVLCIASSLDGPVRV